MTQRIKKAFNKLIDSRASEWIDEQYVYLGSDDGVTVQIADKPGAYYARQLNGDVIEVYNTANIPPHFNLQVKIGRSRSLPTIWQIIHIRQTFDVPVGFGEVGYHAHQHMHDGGDRLPVDRRQILQLSVFVSNSAGFIVRVNGSIVPTATGLAMVSTQDVDLSSHVITAGAKYVSIETNDSGTLSTNAGSVFASPEIATAANIPAPAAGKYHIAHVLFHEGQTGLLDTDIGIPWPLNSFPVTSGSQINTATADTPLDADKFGFWDVVDSALKSITWLNIKATLKTYFDTLYSVLGHSHSAPDASVVTYTPTTVADWDGSADPGDTDNALDQLAERVTDVEGGAAGGFSKGYLFGLTLSNNVTDATNDIDIATGQCRSSDDGVNLILASALIKRLDSTWVTGTNQGGRASSQSLANGTWHVFLIRVAGVDDVGFDTSATAANLVTDHSATHIRRIGSIIRSTGVILPFKQDDDLFQLKTSVQDVNGTNNPGTSAVTSTLTAPVGIRVRAELKVGLIWSHAANTNALLVSDLSVNDEAPSYNNSQVTVLPIGASGASGSQASVLTNTSAQVRYRVLASDASTYVYIRTCGWIDPRGKLS